MRKFLLLLTLFIFILPACSFALEISSPNVILIDADSGKILYEKNAYTPVYPASTTKILTAILALENCNLDDMATASYNAIMSVPWDGTTAAIQVGESWKISQLIDAMMVCSANEAANVIAEHIGGDIPSFASMMNTRAKEIGAKSTNFVNPNGLHDDKHKTTAYDMAMITRYGLKNYPYLKKSASLTNFSLPDTSNYTKSDRYFANTNKMLIKSSTYYYPFSTGLKTGYTNSALNCIVATAEKDGVELIAVIFGAMGAKNRTDDSIALFEYGFSKLKSATFLSAGSIVTETDIPGGPANAKTLKITVSENIVHTIEANKSGDNYLPVITLNENLKAPVAEGQIVGTITYDIEGNFYEYDLIAVNKVESVLDNMAAATVATAKLIAQVIFWAVLSVIGIIIGLILLRAAIITKKQNYRRRRRAFYNSRFR